MSVKRTGTVGQQGQTVTTNFCRSHWAINQSINQSITVP